MGKRKSSKKPQVKRVKQVLGASPVFGDFQLSHRADKVRSSRQVVPMLVLRPPGERDLQDVRQELACPVWSAKLMKPARRDNKTRIGRLDCKDCGQSFQVRSALSG